MARYCRAKAILGLGLGYCRSIVGVDLGVC